MIYAQERAGDWLWLTLCEDPEAFEWLGETYSLKDSRYAYRPNFTDQKIQAHGGKETCLKSYPFELHPLSKQSSEVSNVAPRPG